MFLGTFLVSENLISSPLKLLFTASSILDSVALSKPVVLLGFLANLVSSFLDAVDSSAIWSVPPSMLFCCLAFSPSLNKAFLASSLANLVLANIASPKPCIPTGFPSALLA